MNIVRSEVFHIFASKGLPMHLYCADTDEQVELCFTRNGVLITANDPAKTLRFLKERGLHD